MLCRALEATGLREFSVGVGDATLYPTLLDAYGVPGGGARAAAARARRRATSSGSTASSARSGSTRRPRATLLAGPAAARRRRACSTRRPGRCATRSTGCARVHRRCSTPDVAARVIFDLGRCPRLGYYTGAMFEVYDPELGEPLGGGGRYDDLLGRFGRPLPGGRVRARRRPAARRARRRGARGDEPVNRFGLTIAVPRGALLTETLDALDGIGIDTAEVRANDRKLLFEDVGIVTMRPSDVADLRRGRRRRHRHHRQGRADGAARARRSSSCSTSASGRAAWSSPRPPARTRPPRRCAGSASCASRRSTRGSPPSTSSATGRQAEIVEVKGSVELAPLTGLAEAIVDLTATGTTLRENGLVIREEIATSTARLIANRVAHRVKAAASTTSSSALRGG